MHEVQLTHHEIDLVVDFMRKASGNDLTDKDALVNSKISMLCDQVGYRHFYELWDDLQAANIRSARLRQQVIDELTTSYSYFYREDSHFALLARLIAEGALPIGTTPLRVWSAGCASGEEPCNIAMTLEDARRSGTLSVPYHVVGSDISSKAVEAARKGLYDAADIARMPPHWRNLYCTQGTEGYSISAHLQSHVEYRRENALSPRLDTPFDVVMCRNMIIYFDESSIEKFCTVLRNRLKPGGFLFLGHTEIMSGLQGFTYIEPSLWRRNADESDDLLSLLAPCRTH